MARTRSLPTILLSLCAALPVSALAAGTAPELDRERIREVATRSTALLQQSAQAWVMTQNCASCHHQGLATVAVALAGKKGIPIDGRKLSLQSDRLARRLEERSGQHAFALATSNPAIGESYLLWALTAAGRPAGLDSELVVHALAGRQGADGRWSSVEHQPPLEDSAITATALTLRALVERAPPGRVQEMEGRVERARSWLEAAIPRETEEAVFRLLGLHWAGASAEPAAADGSEETGAEGSLARALDDLRAKQREDGGWSQLPTRGSDAYATGQALVVLHQVGGEAVDGERFRRGIRFLLDSAEDERAWKVRSRRRGPRRPDVETGFPFGRDQFSSYAGTAWATMALAVALEPGPSPLLEAQPVPRVEKPERRLPTVIETALLGDLEDLRIALEACEGEQLAGVRGPHGITPLIAAVHDPAKVELLLEHGAEVAATTELGLGAVHVAAYYDGALGSLELLLDAGAGVERPTNLGLLPVYLAAISGRVDTVELLRARGASLDRWSVGSAPPDPLLVAVKRQDESLVDYLLSSRRARRWGRTPEGFSPLVLAVQTRSTELVARLLEAGADLGESDREGETALHWAAMVDPGHDGIVERLVRAGANLAGRNAYGLVAAETAQHFGHLHLVPGARGNLETTGDEE
ncbi:MAG TPA: ankyrin repeat domain-containing protein [Thermoanaerobaculia bacterium]|nr:ankyrin repeat domain-containing protein [Thermoanaerobaculia bacterium]